MEKIKKLKRIFSKELIDGYLIQKMTNFLMNMYQVRMID